MALINAAIEYKFLQEAVMEFSTFALIVFGILAAVVVICSAILYPELRDVVKELKKNS